MSNGTMTSISLSTQPTTHSIFEIEFGVSIVITFTLEFFRNGTNRSRIMNITCNMQL